jgi:hypothetical protein
MDSELQALQQRVSDLEAAMGEIMNVVIPAISRQGGEIGALNAFLSGLAEMMPPEAEQLEAIRTNFENRYVEVLNGSLNPEYTAQFEQERERLLDLLNTQPSGYKQKSD